MRLFIAICILLTFSTPKTTYAQNKSEVQKKWIGKSILQDQAKIWTSPLRIKKKDLNYLIPFAVIGTALFLNDERISDNVIEFRDRNDLFHNTSKNATLQAETWAQGAMPIATYLLGAAIKNEKIKQTGAILASSVINNAIVTFAIKGITGRQRPAYDNRKDKWHWFQLRKFDSFPSGHSSGAWAIATTIAKRHNSNIVVPIICYTLASSVSISRVVLERHWSSDVFVGAAIGYGIGSYMARKHKNSKWKVFPSLGKESMSLSMVYNL